MSKKAPNDNSIDVELTEEVAEGSYSNLVMISHSQSEFVMDFIVMLPGMPKAKVKSRMILTPEHAKAVLSALKENIEIYEKNFGKIGSHNFNIPPFGKIGEA
jgi:hypothetical protein